MSREKLLLYARGVEPEQSHLVFYHVNPATGDIVIHSCKKCLGEDTWIRFCDYTGRVKEVEVSKEAIRAAIEAHE